MFGTHLRPRVYDIFCCSNAIKIFVSPIELRQKVVAARLGGKSPREVTEITGLSVQTQARYLRKLKTEGTLVPTTPNRSSGPHNSTERSGGDQSEEGKEVP